jgi:hypothetical protein
VRKLEAEFGEAHLPKAGWIRFQPKRLWPWTQARASVQITPDRLDVPHACFTQPLARGTVKNSRTKVVSPRAVCESISGPKNVSAAGFTILRRRGMAHARPFHAKRRRQMKHQPLEKGCGTRSWSRSGSPSLREWRRPR